MNFVLSARPLTANCPSSRRNHRAILSGSQKNKVVAGSHTYTPTPYPRRGLLLPAICDNVASQISPGPDNNCVTLNSDRDRKRGYRCGVEVRVSSASIYPRLVYYSCTYTYSARPKYHGYTKVVTLPVIDLRIISSIISF